jgi:hypothetical protein
MYWTLTGYLAGFVTAFFLHALFTGAVMIDRLYAIPFVILLVLFIAADTESWFLGRWKRAIEKRRADGTLSRYYCTGIGAGVGLLVYPIAAFLWHLEEESRWSSGVGIALLVSLLGAALFLVWYLLTRFPKSNDVT